MGRQAYPITKSPAKPSSGSGRCTRSCKIRRLRCREAPIWRCSGHSLTANPDSLHSEGRHSVLCFWLQCHRSPRYSLVCLWDVAEEGIREWRRHLLHQRQSDVPRPGWKARYQRPSTSKRQNRGIGSWLRRLDRCSQSYGSYRDGTLRRWAPSAGRCMAADKPQHREILVGCRPRCHGGREV